MPFVFENLGLLFGLSALAVPIILHLLQRRHSDVIDWAAMQFLPQTDVTRRRRWLNEMLLLLARMAIITLLVMALAGPIATSTWLASLGEKPTRDVVIVIDASFSMGQRSSKQPTPWNEALQAARETIAGASRGDRFAIALARQPAAFVQTEFSGDADSLLAMIDTLPPPRGNPDLPGAIAISWTHLRTNGRAARREIIIITDMQRHGWADSASLRTLENMGIGWRAEIEAAKTDGSVVPSVRLIPVGRSLTADAPNYSLAPVVVSHGMVKVGQRVAFTSALRLDQFARFKRPTAVHATINDAKLPDLQIPEIAGLTTGQIPLRLEHRFEQIGRHVLTIQIEADPASDALEADNVRHAIVDVVRDVPVLLIDGDARLSPESSTFFIRKALTNKTGDGVRAIPVNDWRPGEPMKQKPAVIVLADVPSLNATQMKAIEAHLADAGGVLVAAGPRMAQHLAAWNDLALLRGEGWLPTRLDGVGISKDPLSPDPRTFLHPALDLFRRTADLDMRQIRVARWCKAAAKPTDRAATVARLTNGEPLLVEKRYKKGKVVLCTIPLDRQWDSTFPGSWEYPVIVNELIGSLAGGQSRASVLQAGDGIQIEEADAGTNRLTLRTPDVPPKTFDVPAWPWRYTETSTIGRYDVTSSNGKYLPFAVEPDPGESDLTRCTDDDRRRIRERLPIVFSDSSDSTATSAVDDTSREEIWWLLLIAVLAFLCVEVWMTRRVAMGRGR